MGHDFAGIRQARQHWGQHRALGGGHVGGDPTTTTTDIFGILFPTTTTTEPRTSSTTTTTTTTSTPHTLLPVTSASTTSTTTSSSTSTTSSTTTSSRVSSTHTSSTATSSSSSFHLETPTTTASPHTVAVTVSAAGTAASASTSATPKGATSNTGTIIGGVAAGILGFALLLAALSFILRRLRRKKDEHIDFDPNSFRRSAVQIHDDDASSFNPRPPVMTENRSNVAMSFGTMYGAPGPQQQYTQPYYTSSVASSNVNSANPLFAPAMYGHNQYSPQPSPMVAGMYPSYSDEGHAVGSPLTRQPSAHTVNSAHTSGPVQYATYPAMPTTGTREEPLPTGDYADLERSSVTPFQAAQYVEIAKRIDSEPPRGLDTPAVEEYMHRRNDSLPPVPPKDPFDDPSSSVKSGSHHLSTASSEVMPHGELDFPVPPSPAHTTSSRYRIDSMPPSLPELKMDLHHSVSSYDFPSSIRGSEDSTLMSTGAKKDIAPSPLANSFSAKPRPETVYDMEDAYGGIN